MKKTEKSQFLGHGSCDKCGSTDAVGIYEVGPATCFNCGAVHPNPIEAKKKEGNNMATEVLDFTKMDDKPPRIPLSEIADYSVRGFKDRGIPKVITEFFGVKAGVNSQNEVIEHYYPYGIREVVGYKVRELPKKFSVIGKLEGLFGQKEFNGGKRLVITEGEMDAMAVAYATHQKYNTIYPVVSLPSASGMKALLEQRDWVRSFDEVVLLMDNDEAGQKALKEACKIVGVDKAKIGRLRTKDANQELQEHGYTAIMKAIWDAQPYAPAGIVQGDALWDQFVERELIESVPYPPCLAGLNHRIRGVRMGEVDLYTSGTGSGKSTLIKEIILHLHQTTEDKISMISLEEGPGETVEKFLSMELGTDLQDDNEVSEEDKKAAFDRVFADGRISMLDHQGSVSDGSLMEKIETMCLMGSKYLILDHLTIAVSEAEGNANEAVDKVMSDLLKMAKKYNVWFGVISHLRKVGAGQGKTFEEGKLPSMDDIKGSGSIKQIAFQIIGFARDLTSENLTVKNTIKIRVLKSRINGNTGNAGGAFYNSETGRLSYVESVAETVFVEEDL